MEGVKLIAGHLQLKFNAYKEKCFAKKNPCRLYSVNYELPDVFRSEATLKSFYPSLTYSDSHSLTYLFPLYLQSNGKQNLLYKIPNDILLHFICRELNI